MWFLDRHTKKGIAQELMQLLSVKQAEQFVCLTINRVICFFFLSPSFCIVCLDDKSNPFKIIIINAINQRIFNTGWNTYQFFPPLIFNIACHCNGSSM